MFVYTSYDGDLISKIDTFIAFVLSKGFIPLNPTKMLGYYDSTIAHSNSKKEAMIDCLAIENLADEFWIFLDNNSFELPEGVLMELIYWINNDKGNIRVFHVSDVHEELFNKNEKNRSENIVDKLELIKKLNNEKIEELSEHLSNELYLRKTIFIDIEDKYYKYIDWIKIYSFSQNFVPIDIKSVISDFFLNKYLSNDEYASILEKLKGKVDDYVKITEYNSGNNFWSLKDANVPKYTSSSWALTKTEQLKG
ncbi:hypothetical protein [Companilactobacillus metriopterae]|uniref:hypothetical protein n=1 Tax=Companilactobacillus metriopterae TaxID=1909267 RepID=UPI00100BBC4C|nr:hypothetical protein [Companilactobacillus metriopterae]